jgi:protein-S-isoprenylcysteine O-methyltransferase Ste14
LFAPVVAAILYKLCIPHEEAHLRREFGATYDRYRERVGGIVPRLCRP